MKVILNGREYSARHHAARKGGSRQPKYIEDGEPFRTDAFGKSYYLGKRKGKRITVQAEKSWWYVDDEDLYKQLSKPPRSKK